MTERKRHSHKDVEKKLDKYMAINKQISKKLTSKRTEIRKLKNLLTKCTSDIINVRTECRNWKGNVLKIRNMHMDQEAISHSDKINSMLDECIAEMDHYLATSFPATIEYTKKWPKKSKAKRNDIMVMISEESEPEDSLRIAECRKPVVRDVANNVSSKGTADIEGGCEENIENGVEKKQFEEGFHIFFHNDEENAEQDENKLDQMSVLTANNKLAKKSEEESPTDLSVNSRPKRNVSKTKFLRY